LFHVDFPSSSKQSFCILCSSSGFRQFPWRRSLNEWDGEVNQEGGDCRFVRQCGKPAAAYSLKLQGIGACAIVGANNYQSCTFSLNFKIRDLVDRRRSHETDRRIQLLNAPAVGAWGSDE